MALTRRAVRHQPRRRPSSPRSCSATTCGTAAGLMAGAFTESTVIGTAGDTIARLRSAGRGEGAAAEQHSGGLRGQLSRRHRLRRLVPLEPRAAAAAGRPRRPRAASSRRELARRPETEAGRAPPTASGTCAPSGSPAAWAGRTRRRRRGVLRPDARLRRADPPRRQRPRRRAGHACSQAGDVVAVAGAPARAPRAGSPFGEEVEDRELLDFPMAAARRGRSRTGEVADRTLAEVAEEHGRGVVAARSSIRGGEEIPFDAGDGRSTAATCSGSPAPAPTSSAPGAALGYVERPSSETDVVFVGLGILIGGLFGLLTLTVGDVPLSLTASGGALIMGLVFGWLRSVRPDLRPHSRSRRSGSSTPSASRSSSASSASAPARASCRACARPARACCRRLRRRPDPARRRRCSSGATS